MTVHTIRENIGVYFSKLRIAEAKYKNLSCHKGQEVTYENSKQYN